MTLGSSRLPSCWEGWRAQSKLPVTKLQAHHATPATGLVAAHNGLRHQGHYCGRNLTLYLLRPRSQTPLLLPLPAKWNFPRASELKSCVGSFKRCSLDHVPGFSCKGGWRRNVCFLYLFCKCLSKAKAFTWGRAAREHSKCLVQGGGFLLGVRESS